MSSEREVLQNCQRERKRSGNLVEKRPQCGWIERVVSAEAKKVVMLASREYNVDEASERFSQNSQLKRKRSGNLGVKKSKVVEWCCKTLIPLFDGSPHLTSLGIPEGHS